MATKHLSLELVFEPMRLRDLQQVLKIENACFENPWSGAGFTLHLKRPKSYEHFYVARHKDTVAGYIVFNVLCEEGHILNIAVQPRYQRQGIGKYMLASALKIVQEQEGHVVFLEVAVSNLPAQYLYRQFGFRICGIRKHYYGHHKDAYLFRKGETDAT